MCISLHETTRGRTFVHPVLFKRNSEVDVKVEIVKCLGSVPKCKEAESSFFLILSRKILSLQITN